MTHSFLKFTLPLLCAGLLLGSANAQSAAPVSPAVSVETVTVQQGDTAYSIAKRAGLSVDNLLLLNGLPNSNVKIGQVLIVRSTPAHVVQAGETLYALSRKYGVSVDAIRAANDLSAEATIAVGQSLKIPAASVPAVATATTAPVAKVAAQSVPVVTVQAAPAPIAQQEPAQAVSAQAAPVTVPTSTVMPDFLSGSWREMAMALVGTPYVWGGQNRTGTDCSGFVLQVFSPLGVRLPRQSADQARAGVAVDINNLQAGDLVFFDTVGGGKVTHVGIYLGNDTFVNANSYRGKVTVDRLKSDKYWAQRYLSARRVLPDTLLASQP